jgi:hypothetical protein
VEVLIITELFNLQDFMERPQEARFLPDNERRYYERALKSPWLGVIRDYSVAFLYFGAVIAGVESLAAFGWIGEVARDIMRYVMAAIAIGYGIIAIFSVPRVIRANSVIRSMLDDARVAIEKVIELLRDGAASVADVKKRVAQAEAAEVVWPSSLAPLLNDIAARRLSLWVPPS